MSYCPKHHDILDALNDRTTWENKLTTWYQMRHDGLRRRNKPWPNAADMHFPLADMLIEKLKPTYVAQIFATETVASFVALKQEFMGHQNACASFYDYRLKQQSNFEAEMMVAIDTMLQNAKGIVKVFWDAAAKRIRFESINPHHLIVPSWTGPLAEADWIVHVQQFSKAKYLRMENFVRDEATMAVITSTDDTAAREDQVRYTREGITKPTKGQIVVWEVFYRDERNQWRVKTYSPNKPDLALRPEFGLPYNQGVFGESMPPPPFAELNAELKERGFFSPRGICERVMPHEVSLCKDWNTMKDYQTLTCSPLFYAQQGVPQNANLRMVPGQILPFQLQAVQFPTLPTDLPNSMLATRGIAEQLVALPDAGLGRSTDQSKPKTAAETNLLGSIAGRNDDLRSRTFRRELAHLLNLGWGILLQYAGDDLQYFADDQLLALPKDALSGAYRIEPNGSGDNYNRTMVLQRAMARKQLFTNNPNINQLELDRSVLEADDPRLVKRLLVNAGTQAAQQQEDQAQEISILLLGFPAEVRQTDDDWAHIQSCVGFVQRRAKTGEPMNGEFLANLAMHTEAHLNALKAKNRALWQQKQPLVASFVRELRATAQQEQQQQQQMAAAAGGAAPANIAPFPAAVA